MSTKKKKKPKLISLKKLKKKCDKLLTPIAKLLRPECELCGEPTQVAHHHVHYSKSLKLRYEVSNLISLCNKCHLKLGHNESFWACVILVQRGIKWFKELRKLGVGKVHANREWYESTLARLTKTYEDLLVPNLISKVSGMTSETAEG